MQGAVHRNLLGQRPQPPSLTHVACALLTAEDHVLGRRISGLGDVKLLSVVQVNGGPWGLSGRLEKDVSITVDITAWGVDRGSTGWQRVERCSGVGGLRGPRSGGKRVAVPACGQALCTPLQEVGRAVLKVGHVEGAVS